MSYVTNATTTLEMFLETDTGGDVAHFAEDPPVESDIAGPTLTIDTWFFLCMVRTNTSRSLYYATEAGGTPTKVTNTDTRNSNTGTISRIDFGNDPFTEPFNGELWGARFWETNLSDAEIATELCNSTPQKASVRGDWRLTSAATATTDSSGNALTLTSSGTLADGAGNPTIPSCGGAAQTGTKSLRGFGK